MHQSFAAALQPGTVFQGRYRVVRCIKAGGMGAVYEVVDDRTESPRALKVMLPSVVEDPDLRARFALEAKITGTILSDHLVRVLDAGIDEASRTPFLVMELLQGDELWSLVKKRGPLPSDEVLLYLRHAALALDKTHAAGIVHRDLKPENLFITHRDDGSPCVKILDFGIAKVVAHSAGQATRPMGTPLYMSPEQIRGDGTVSPRADIYAIGHIAYALLVGEPYWNVELKAAGSIYPLIPLILAGLPEHPSARAQRRRGVLLPAAFDIWFATCVAVQPEHRYERATAAVAALAEAFAAGSPRAVLPSVAPAEVAMSPTDMRTTVALGDGARAQSGGTSVAVISAASRRAPARPVFILLAVALVAVLALVTILAIALRTSPPASVSAATSTAEPSAAPAVHSAVTQPIVAPPTPPSSASAAPAVPTGSPSMAPSTSAVAPAPPAKSPRPATQRAPAGPPPTPTAEPAHRGLF